MEKQELPRIWILICSKDSVFVPSDEIKCDKCPHICYVSSFVAENDPYWKDRDSQICVCCAGTAGVRNLVKQARQDYESKMRLYEYMNTHKGPWDLSPGE